MSPTIPDVAVIGLGYIGLPTAALLAHRGSTVLGVDINQATVDAVNRGEVPFVEPDLAGYVASSVRSGTLRATTSAASAKAYILAVPTPVLPDHSADLSYVEDAARAIAPHLDDGALVILESTSPPGTTRRVADCVLGLRPDLSADGSHGRGTVHFAYCPERVLPGKIMAELVSNDRIVGGLTHESARLARDLYATVCRGGIHLTDDLTAEAAKLTENSFRDVNIAFANELSLIAARLGINVWELIELANRHPRVNILQPGPGVGGHCIAVDPWFLVAAAPDESRLIRTAREVNDAKPDYVLGRMSQAVSDHPGAVVAVLGLAFKANVDDLRESPSLHIAERFAAEHPHVEVLVVEPHVSELPPSLRGRPAVTLSGLDDALARADIVTLLVDHAPFTAIERDRLVDKVVIDTRGTWRERRRSKTSA